MFQIIEVFFWPGYWTLYKDSGTPQKAEWKPQVRGSLRDHFILNAPLSPVKSIIKK